VRLQQSALSRGEAQYRDRQNEVRAAAYKHWLPSMPCLEAVSPACPTHRPLCGVSQVRVATIRITDLQRELNVAAAAASHVGALQDHCHRLSRQLLQVRDALQRSLAAALGLRFALLCILQMQQPLIPVLSVFYLYAARLIDTGCNVRIITQNFAIPCFAPTPECL